MPILLIFSISLKNVFYKHVWVDFHIIKIHVLQKLCIHYITI